MPDQFKVLDPIKDIKTQNFAIQNDLISVSSSTDAVTNNVSIFTIGPSSAGFINQPDAYGSTTAGFSPSGGINSVAMFFFNRYGPDFYNSASGVYTLPASHSASLNVVTARIIDVADPTKDHGIWPDTVTAVLKYNGVSYTAVDSAADSFGTNKESLLYGKLTDASNPAHVLGSIFYDYGVILLHGGTGAASATTNAAVTGFALNSSYTGALTSSTATICLASVSFQTYKILTRNIFFCRLLNNEFNYTSNPSANGVTFLQTETNATTYVSTLGLYDDRDNLLAVAKISPPYRKNAYREAVFAVTLSV